MRRLIFATLIAAAPLGAQNAKTDAILTSIDAHSAHYADVAHQIGVGDDGRQQHVLLGVGERRALRLDIGLRGLGVGHGLAAAEDRLGGGQQRRAAPQRVIAVRAPDRQRIGLAPVEPDV